MVSEKNFKNTLIYRIGGEWACRKKFVWRFGAIYDTTPVDLALYGPETPGANKFSVTTGCTYHLSRALAVDFGFQALFGEKTFGSVPDSATTTFSGHYTSSALIPALGIRLNF
jgi:long-chain fatty acid transport protein